MTDRAEMQLGALEPEQFLPKFVFESGITIGDNRVGNSMDFEDIFHEKLNHDG